MPTFGSTVQNGKFAASALAFERELNRVLLPTLGNPTMPHENPIELDRAAQNGVPAAVCKAPQRQNLALPSLPSDLARSAQPAVRRHAQEAVDHGSAGRRLAHAAL